ncbi:MAG: peptide-methionine (S)-S-oxide reductase MsrA [Cyclobacteriaceae bacterium]
MEKATFGSGCFWCIEAIFQRVKGVDEVVSGYSGGHIKNPAYREVCNGVTGHAEVVQIKYDPEAVSFDELLEVFWKTHDPTTLNRQGYDVGTQYRSAIFYHSEEQRKKAVHYKQKLEEEDIFGAPIVTEIVPFENFYVADGDHQNFYNENMSQPYCQAIIVPKLKKLEKVFADKIK